MYEPASPASALSPARWSVDGLLALDLVADLPSASAAAAVLAGEDARSMSIQIHYYSRKRKWHAGGACLLLRYASLGGEGRGGEGRSWAG
jgi:hypothetical protein